VKKQDNPGKNLLKGNKKLKIFHLITGLGTGGAELHLLKTLPLMKDTNNVVCSVTSANEIGRKIAGYGIKVIYLSQESKENKDEKLRIINVIKNLKKVINEEKPDILSTYLIHSDLLGRVLGKITGVKKVICNVRVTEQKKYLLFLERSSKFLVDEYIANSNSVKAFLVKNQKINPEVIHVIPNGIDLKKIEKIKPIGASKISNALIRKNVLIRNDDYLIVCVGRLHEQKGQVYLIRAMKKVISACSNTKLIFVGDGEKRKEYEEEIKLLELENNVFLIGKRESEDTISIMKSSGLFVLPTNYEGMSNSILEAMACKLPIITTNIPENKELITNEKEGILVNPKDADALAEKIIFAIKNRKKTRSFAEAAFRKVRKYDIQKTAKMFEKEYKKIMKAD
jgi:glycosyltransferase involved in cell wall biosynthesis